MGYRDTVRHQQMTGRIAREMREPSVPALATKGDRVRLLRTSDPYTQLKPGDEGMVSFVDSMGTVHVNWESGSTLGLVPGEDQFLVLR
jgi:hypothetical protein